MNTSPSNPSGPKRNVRLAPEEIGLITGECRLDQKPARRFRLFPSLVLLGLALFLAWASVSEVDEVRRVKGRIISSALPVVAAAQRNATVREILVKRGDMVSLDQPLAFLDEVPTGDAGRENKARTDFLAAEKARLSAEAQGATPVFPPSLVRDRPELIEQEKALFTQRQERLRQDIKDQETLQVQNGRNAALLKARIGESRAGLGRLQRGLALAREAFDPRSASQAERIRRLEKDVDLLTTRIETDLAAYQSAESAFQHGRERIVGLGAAFRDDAAKEAARLDKELASLSLASDPAKNETPATRVAARAPATGVVSSLRALVAGGFVKAGEPLMEILPASDRIVVEADLSPEDAALVAKGQRAALTISSPGAAGPRQAEGMVSHVGPSLAGGASATARIELDRARDPRLGSDKDTAPVLAPGTPATAAINVGRRTVLQWALSSLSLGSSRTARTSPASGQTSVPASSQPAKTSP